MICKYVFLIDHVPLLFDSFFCYIESFGGLEGSQHIIWGPRVAGQFLA